MFEKAVLLFGRQTLFCCGAASFVGKGWNLVGPETSQEPAPSSARRRAVRGVGQTWSAGFCLRGSCSGVEEGGTHAFAVRCARGWGEMATAEQSGPGASPEARRDLRATPSGRHGGILGKLTWWSGRERRPCERDWLLHEKHSVCHCYLFRHHRER